ncbi:MarR family winged helix-turn-helix transcriptional regulator [Umezawaea tangerina]|uniref:DNA-binding MarR family transcriptional regulator n=1 Tax=Umezawaea tangerina TaxID=84725 RepID=A0A2T0SMX3_9PSEU|nr:MarR family winged helix-turn-helix transcriptional regulator [Umezawaea tangerina]PRY34771.1 DNA-binding MarR family transcriptional regulator [Umezawaea tangerina]
MDFREAPARLRALPSYAITLAAARAGQLVVDRVAELGVSKAAYGVLAVIEEFGPSSQADLGRRLGMDRRSVSEEAVGLEHAGLVSRGPDPADSRRNRLEITAAGRDVLARLDSSFRAVQDELFASLSPADRAELDRILALVVAPAST